MIALEAIQIVHEAIAEAVEAARMGDEATANARWVEAANLALKADGIDGEVADKREAVELLQRLEKNLAEEGRFVEVAVLLWGNGMFDSRPSVVQQVFEAVQKNHKLIILGASSLSKTFSCGVLFYVFWRQDPYWTAVKLAAPSEDHLYTNLFSHLVALHKGAVIPMTDDDAAKVKVNETDLFISMADALPEMRIQGVLCKQSQISAGALRGHKPKPYRKPVHPKYGNSTRIFILIDEGTQVSPGAFEDIKTTEASIDPALDTVKIVMPCNPEGVQYKIVQMAEPEGGWDAEQVDTLYEWTSKQGYPVLRLDGKRFENVVERRTIYPRMLTYEAFLGFLRAGEHSASYWAKGRGFPPLKDNAYTIIPPSWVNSQRGDPIYVGRVENIAALDTALGGGDKAILGVGRWGEAAGWRKLNGEIEWFVNRTDPDKRVNRHVCVLDQLFELPKTPSTTQMVQEVMGRCKNMGIPPENLAMDKMQPVSEPVLTPSGWVPIGQIRAGDFVIGSDGKRVRVLAVHPQLDRRVFRVTLNGGSEWTRCGPKHLWFAHKLSKNSPEIISTEKILEDMQRCKTHKKQKLWTIPRISGPVLYESRGGLPVDPYLLGLLLGDGNIRKYGIRYSSADAFLVNEVARRIPDGMKIKHDDRYCYTIYNPEYKRDRHGRDFAIGRNELLQRMRALGLSGVNGPLKFIPEIYMLASPEDRLEVVRGLMDTDGFVNLTKGATSSPCVGIRLSSERMIRQIMELCQSLGGRATYRTHKAFSPRDPTRRIRDAHVATLMFPTGVVPFRLPRKVAQYENRTRNLTRFIYSITQEPDEDSVCITVDSKDGLYVTRNFIVTHNCGNAAGVWSHAKSFWGDVLGVDNGSAASEEKVLADDNMTAYDVYALKATELWFALKRWLDPVVCAVLINQPVPTHPLFTQLTTRRYHNVKGGRVQVEAKDIYRARNAGHSPDEADVLTLLVEWCRQRGKVLPGIIEKPNEERREERHVTSLKNADEPEPLETQPEWVPGRMDAE
jgi:hypothetical protein